jgi:hypothetical protein
MRTLKNSLFAAQNIFSTILKLASLQTQNLPFGLKHWLCGRSASLRMVTEKNFNSRSELVFLVFQRSHYNPKRWFTVS